MNRVDDQYYIDRIIAGNSGEFAVLVNRYKDMVFTLAYKMIKNREQAEEVCQDAFVKTFKSLDTFKAESKFSTWLYKITYNSCLDHLKKYKNINSIVSFEDLSEGQLTAMENILDETDQAERNQKIQQCLHLMAGEEAFLLILYYFDDLSIEDMAKVLKTNSNNVKIKLFRSRKKLATILREQLEPEIIAYYEKERK
jgi:RNA polymerase sigma factor (sigma-70 family)